MLHYKKAVKRWENKLTGIKKKHFFIGVIVAVLVFSSFSVYAKSLMENIFCRFNESRKLDQKIVKKLRFELYKKQNLKGTNQKYLFKSNNNDLWLFKVYHPSSNSQRRKVSRCVYLLAQLLGISTPVVYEISLPINGKIRYGIIQKFICGAMVVDEEIIKKLSDNQIREIQNHWVFDWLIFNTDPSSQHFLLEPKTKKVIGIDKDLCLCDMGLISLDKDPWSNTYYPNFWNAYINNKINIDFEETFSFTEYIQSIEKKELIKILSLAIEKEELMDKFFLRIQNLNKHFKNFYCKLFNLKGEQFRIIVNGNKEEYSKLVLEKIENIVLGKRCLLENLKAQKKTKQNNIIVVSSKDAWDIIDELNCFDEIVDTLYIKEVIGTFQCLEKGNVNIYEKLAINLYIEEVKKKYIEKDIESFPIVEEIMFITLNPNQINNKKTFELECNFRAVYREKSEMVLEYKGKFVKEYEDVFLHLNYVLFFARENDKARALFLKEYKKYREKISSRLVGDVLYGILLRDLDYFEKIKDVELKYLGMAFVCSFESDKDKVVKYCNKVISLNNDSFIAYESHLLMGLIYEYNEEWKRFGEGFQIEQSVMAYKKALVINPKSVKAHLNLGILYLIMEKPCKALNKFKEVNRLDNEYGKEHFHFDRVGERSSYKDRKEYLNAIKMNTLSGRHHYVIGLACLVKGDKISAQKHFNKVCEFGYKDE